MSWHVQPSERLESIIDQHVGPMPERPAKGAAIDATHPYLRWHLERTKVLMDAVDQALATREAEISREEARTMDRVALGQVPLVVLGHPCVWIGASVSLVLRSYLGRVVLADEAAA